MEIQFYLRIYATTGVVRKADAKKMTYIYYWGLSERVLEITAGNNIEHAQKELTRIRSRKYSKQYNYEIIKVIFTTECNRQTVTKIVESGIL